MAEGQQETDVGNEGAERKKGADAPSLWKLENGLQVVCLPLPYVDYVAANLILPGGVINDPEQELGSSLLLAELLSRGAGELTSQQLLTEFDTHGIRHGESASLLSAHLHCSFLPDKTEQALHLLSLMLTQPSFPADSIEPVKALFLHDIRSVRENPARWSMLELTKRFFPAPYNRSPLGEEQGVLSVTRDSLVSQWSNRFGPKGSVLSIAGRVDESDIRSLVEEKLGGWQGENEELPKIPDFPERQRYFLPFPGTQQQLGLKFPSAPMESKHYYTGKVFSQILSGGMFGRLFVEVREKRGLCYSVYAQHSGRPEYGTLTVYAGTTPERVHETHDVICDILANPLEGLTEKELARAKNNLLSQIVLSEESTSSRSRSNAADWMLLGRVRSLQEIQQAVLEVDEAMLQEFLNTYPLEQPAALTLGARNFDNWEEQSLEVAADSAQGGDRG